MITHKNKHVFFKWGSGTLRLSLDFGPSETGPNGSFSIKG